MCKSKSLPEERSPRWATKPPSSVVCPARVDPVTFSPMCDISPIKSQESHWTVSDQTGLKPSGVSEAAVQLSLSLEECPPPDVRLHGWRQQKITSFVSTCSPAKTHSYNSYTLSKDLSVRKVDCYRWRLLCLARGFCKHRVSPAFYLKWSHGERRLICREKERPWIRI